ncbi:dihydroneopterin aldolase [bacterium LRH843]|nr:dihydroneopterin aldolase [bacterium LRH843]
MDKIYMNELMFYGYHGVFSEERKLGQRYIVDLTLELDLASAGVSDNLSETIDYGEAYGRVKEIVEGEPYQLIESVAEKVSTELLSAFNRLQACTVKVTKPDPPIPGHYRSVAVEITRSR